MWKKALLTATVAGALAVGSSAAIAQTAAETPEDAPAIAVQTQYQAEIQIPVQDPELMGTEEGLLAQTANQNRQHLRVDTPAECDGECDGVPVQEQAELRVATATQNRVQAQIFDPLCDGECDGLGLGECDGDCDGTPIGDGDGYGPGDGAGISDGTGVGGNGLGGNGLGDGTGTCIIP